MVFAGNLRITIIQYNILFSYECCNRLGLAHLFSSILSLRVLNSQLTIQLSSFRAVTKISSCRVNTTSRQGIKQLYRDFFCFYFSSIFL